MAVHHTTQRASHPQNSQVWYKVGSSPMEGHGCRVAPCREVRFLSWLRWAARWLRAEMMDTCHDSLKVLSKQCPHQEGKSATKPAYTLDRKVK